MATISGVTAVDWAAVPLVPADFDNYIERIDNRYDTIEAAFFNGQFSPVSVGDSQIKVNLFMGGVLTIKGSGLLGSSPVVTSAAWVNGSSSLTVTGKLRYDADGDFLGGTIKSATFKDPGESITMTGSVTVSSAGSYGGKVTKLSWKDDGISYSATGSFSVSGNDFDATVSGTATGFSVTAPGAGLATLKISGASIPLASLQTLTNVNELITLLDTGGHLDGDDTISFLATMAGDTLLNGGLGNDTYIVTSAGQTVTEVAGEGDADMVRLEYDVAVPTTVALSDFPEVEALRAVGTGQFTLEGTVVQNLLQGNSSANTLDGGLGNDVLKGGKGNDTYVVESNDEVIEKLDAGTDTVLSEVTHTLAPNVENLTLTGAGDINGTGNNLKNTLTGNSGANILTGMKGSDTYVLTSIADSVVELAGQGTDTEVVTFTWSLSDNVERLIIADDAGHEGLGNDLANKLTGAAGGDTLDGAAGADTMIGGMGDDQYVVDNAGDVITELSAQGEDTVVAGINYTLGSHLDNLTLTQGAIRGTGNGLANEITGNDAANKLSGGSGNDALVGNAGDDTLTGGKGNDTLTGGADNDLFVFSSATGATNVDTVMDFTVGSDRLRFDNDVFVKLGAAGALSASRFFSGDGQTEATALASHRLIYDEASGNLYYDSNGLTPGSVLIATLAGAPLISAADITVIE